MNLIEAPVAPENFTFIPDEFQPGKYIIGLDKFTLSQFHVNSIFQRQLTSAEEYILGILSVFLIAILSDIAQTVLLRTTNRQMHLNGLVSAYMVHELTHFRNIWSYVKPSHAQHSQRDLWTRRRVWLSVIVLCIALGLFAADVIAVLLTQPSSTSSSKHQYNLVAVQPIRTNIGLSRFIRRLTGDRPCISPIMTGSDQKRNFLLSTCVIFIVNEALAGKNDVSDEITISSWFHKGGSDHLIAIGPGRFNISIRAQVLLGADDGGGRRILFRSLDDASLNHAKYLHKLVYEGAIDWACKNSDAKTCIELREEIKITSKVEPTKIRLWRGRKKREYTNAEGVVSTAKIRMNAPFLAMNAGLRVLLSSAVIMEVEGKGEYVRVSDDGEEDGIEGLLTEDGRVAGMVTFGSILVILGTIMVLLRVCLKPVSLGYVAMSGVQRVAGVDLMANDYFGRVEDGDYWEHMHELGANGLGGRSYSASQRRTAEPSVGDDDNAPHRRQADEYNHMPRDNL